MYKLVTDIAERESLLRTYSGMVNEASLKNFIQKYGYGDDFIRILFKDDLDEYEDQEELEEIKDNQVILLAEPPVSSVEEKIYLSFEELYSYLNCVVNEKYPHNEDIKSMLTKVKQTLRI